MLSTQFPRRIRIFAVVGATLIILLVLLSSSQRPLGIPISQGTADLEHFLSAGSVDTKSEDGQSSPKSSSSSDSETLPCQTLPGASDVLVVMRTGASEIKDKLPIHESTTFRCFGDNLVLYSDYAEVFGGRQVHNVLSDMPQQIIDLNSDFKHYQYIQQHGREGLAISELSGNTSAESGPFGKMDNAGWRLDKYKFLPMINRTLEVERKWYLFVEPDTYVLWSNLLQWIQTLDSSKPAYYGSENMIGDDLFAHGGSAFLLSRPALEKGVEIYRSKPEHYHNITSNHWAGDCVLGIALKDAGVSLSWSWPMFQGGNPSDQMQYELKKGNEKALWCSPVLSFHHFNPQEVADMWRFEQDWLRSVQQQKSSIWSFLTSWSREYGSVLHHREVFKSFVLPKLESERIDWTNSPETYHPGTEDVTIEHCRAMCEANNTCLQYALSPAGCFTGADPRIGRSQEGFQSGWMTKRLKLWVQKLDQCKGNEGWTVS